MLCRTANWRRTPLDALCECQPRLPNNAKLVERLQRLAGLINRLADAQRQRNNLGGVSYLQSWFKEVCTMYENALVDANILRAEAEAMSTSMLYNPARVYEDLNDDARAMEIHEKLLDRHPECVHGTHGCISLVTRC